MMIPDHSGIPGLKEHAYTDENGAIDFTVEQRLITRELERLGLHK